MVLSQDDLLVSCMVPFTVTSRLRFTLFTILNKSQCIAVLFFPFMCLCKYKSPSFLLRAKKKPAAREYCAKSALGDYRRGHKRLMFYMSSLCQMSLVLLRSPICSLPRSLARVHPSSMCRVLIIYLCIYFRP